MTTAKISKNKPLSDMKWLVAQALFNPNPLLSTKAVPVLMEEVQKQPTAAGNVIAQLNGIIRDDRNSFLERYRAKELIPQVRKAAREAVREASRQDVRAAQAERRAVQAKERVPEDARFLVEQTFAEHG